jgi:hypothetical protein
MNTEIAPFRFEDLNGAPEPAHWGPVYPKTASAEVEKWRAIGRGRQLTESEACLYGQAVHAWIRALNAPKKAPSTLPAWSNCASGQTGPFDAKKHRASLIAHLHAQAAADRRDWALGKATDSRGRTIRQAYAAAMAEKANAKLAEAA